MLKKALAEAVDQATFNNLLAPAWKAPNNKSRMGIALSGGQDSMALVALCENYRKSNAGRAFTAFIVDHAARPESGDEARRVCNIVRTKTGINVEILKLAWEHNVKPSELSNFESAARRLRYQALARACAERDITTLLVGHHEDDQAETVLMRMTANHLGSGLAGIGRSVPIPECDGIYGCSSGRPVKVPIAPVAGYSFTEQNVMVEKGGLQIYRPLLRCSKTSLRATCIANGLRWIEDETNADPSLGPRNAIRSLMQNDRLPEALCNLSLLNLAERRAAALRRITDTTEQIFDACIVKLNPVNGSVHVKFPSNIRELLAGNTGAEDPLESARRTAAMLVRRIILLISPMSNLSLPDSRGPTRVLFPFLFPDVDVDNPAPEGVATAAKSLCLIDTQSLALYSVTSEPIQCSFSRTPPTHQDKTAQIQTLLPSVEERDTSTDWTETPFTLFDGRYWIKVRYRPFNLNPGERIVARFLEQSDLDSLKANDEHAVHWRSLQPLLKEKAPGKLRYSLPAIVSTWLTNGRDNKRYVRSKLLALPTLHWSSAGWREYNRHEPQEAWQWIIHYKKVDFTMKPRHGFVG